MTGALTSRMSPSSAAAISVSACLAPDLWGYSTPMTDPQYFDSVTACHLAVPKLSISPMRPQLQEPQTARCVTLVTQARRVGCYRLSLSTPVQVSRAMNRERYRPDAIDGSWSAVRFQKVDDG